MTTSNRKPPALIALAWIGAIAFAVAAAGRLFSPEHDLTRWVYFIYDCCGTGVMGAVAFIWTRRQRR